MARYFVFHDANGKIIRSGSCPDEYFMMQERMLKEGEFLLETDREIDPSEDSVDITSSVISQGTAVVEAPPTGLEHLPEYVQNRITLYPTVQEQLDMMWHAMDDGTAPKVEPWYSLIKSIKESHPSDGTMTYA